MTSERIPSGKIIVIGPIQAAAMQTTGVPAVPLVVEAGPVPGQGQSAAGISVPGREAAPVTVSVTGPEPAAAVLARVIVREAGKEVQDSLIAREVPADHLAAISAVPLRQGTASAVRPAVPICRGVRGAHPVAVAAAQVAVVVVSRDDKCLGP